MFANKNYADFEYARYKISNLQDSTCFGVFNDSGFIELELPDGTYSVEFKTIDMVKFKLDSVTLIPEFKTHLEIKIGTPGGFMTIQER
ncbi:MAG: hypothetical protein QNK23_13630 [Crocinitomicaceae bacterium]|nr:hypothetical protein [Crocinitomicaceae bacterium]